MYILCITGNVNLFILCEGFLILHCIAKQNNCVEMDQNRVSLLE